MSQPRPKRKNIEVTEAVVETDGGLELPVSEEQIEQQPEVANNVTVVEDPLPKGDGINPIKVVNIQFVERVILRGTNRAYGRGEKTQLPTALAEKLINMKLAAYYPA